MQLQRISSLSTVFHKFVLPVIFGIWLLNRLVIWGPPDDTFLFMLILLQCGAYFLWHAWVLKAVAIDKRKRRLYVSNYRKEIAIPFSEIAEVTEFIFFEPRRITIHLHNEMEFGKTMVFLGTYRFGGNWVRPHPIVSELLKLAARDQPPRTPVLGLE